MKKQSYLFIYFTVSFFVLQATQLQGQESHMDIASRLSSEKYVRETWRAGEFVRETRYRTYRNDLPFSETPSELYSNENYDYIETHDPVARGREAFNYVLYQQPDHTKYENYDAKHKALIKNVFLSGKISGEAQVGSLNQSSLSSQAAESFGDSSTAKAVERINDASQKKWRYTENSFSEIPQDGEKLSDTAKAVEQLNNISQKQGWLYTEDSLDLSKFKEKKTGAHSHATKANEELSETAKKVEQLRKDSFSSSTADGQKNLFLKASQDGFDPIKTPWADRYNKVESNERYSITEKPLVEYQNSKYEEPQLLQQDLNKNQSGTGSCVIQHNTGRQAVFNNDYEKKAFENCLNNPNDRSLACVYLITQQAVEAYSTEPRCKNSLSTKKLMCIFEREVGVYKDKSEFKNNCNGNGCGMAQMTTGGAAVVKRAISLYKLDYGFDSFLDMINLPNKKQNKCRLTRKDALDRNTSIIMAATHLCAQAKHSPKASSQFLSCEYQRGLSYCKARGGNTPYSRGIESCERNSHWNLTLASYDVHSKAKCFKNKFCEEIMKSASSKINTNSEVGTQ